MITYSAFTLSPRIVLVVTICPDGFVAQKVLDGTTTIARWDATAEDVAQIMADAATYARQLKAIRDLA